MTAYDTPGQKSLARFGARGRVERVDEFTMYASLTHLKQLPVDVLKLDRSFVRDMERDASDAAIVKAVLSLGKSLAITVMAEGIETAAQVFLLREHGCDLGQGYYFGRPVPGEAIPSLINQLTEVEKV
jgi:EAL domain-containing protein (putative c-di-GMP-specific phosphodiesterase class I)